MIAFIGKVTASSLWLVLRSLIHSTHLISNYQGHKTHHQIRRKSLINCPVQISFPMKRTLRNRNLRWTVHIRTRIHKTKRSNLRYLTCHPRTSTFPTIRRTTSIVHPLTSKKRSSMKLLKPLNFAWLWTMVLKDISHPFTRPQMLPLTMTHHSIRALLKYLNP
jgi:hypothetical protein